MDEVEVNVQQVGLAVGSADDMALPDLVSERLGLLSHLPSHILRR